MTPTRRLLTLLVAAVVAAVAPAGASAQDSTAVAVNTRDGADVFRLAFHIDRVMSDTVDAANAAVAVAGCTECQTVALAIQVVLIMSDPAVVTPENLALAYNLECTLCDTLASAYQLLLTTGGPVRFTAEGSQRVAEIRRSLLELRDSDLSSAEIQARVKVLTSELAEVVATQLVRAGSSSGATDQGGSPATGAGTSTTSPGPSSSTSAPPTTSTPSTFPTSSTTTTSSRSTTSTTSPSSTTSSTSPTTTSTTAPATSSTTGGATTTTPSGG